MCFSNIVCGQHWALYSTPSCSSTKSSYDLGRLASDAVIPLNRYRGRCTPYDQFRGESIPSSTGDCFAKGIGNDMAVSPRNYAQATTAISCDLGMDASSVSQMNRIPLSRSANCFVLPLFHRPVLRFKGLLQGISCQGIRQLVLIIGLVRQSARKQQEKKHIVAAKLAKHYSEKNCQTVLLNGARRTTAFTKQKSNYDKDLSSCFCNTQKSLFHL